METKTVREIAMLEREVVVRLKKIEELEKENMEYISKIKELLNSDK